MHAISCRFRPAIRWKKSRHGKSRIRFLTVSSLSMAADQLRNQMQKDGCLYIKEFFPRSEVLDVRKEIIARIRELNMVLSASITRQTKSGSHPIHVIN
jgi:hypothetical protein